MKIVLQRVKEAKVSVQGNVVGRIGRGALIFLGVGRQDDQTDIDYLVRKVAELRIFEDADGKMNLSAADVAAAFLVISQFTLLGDCRKGRRPSFDQAAPPPQAETLYEKFVQDLRLTALKVETGQFRAMMDVELINDGPVTFILDSRDGSGS